MQKIESLDNNTILENPNSKSSKGEGKKIIPTNRYTFFMTNTKTIIDSTTKQIGT